MFEKSIKRIAEGWYDDTREDEQFGTFPRIFKRELKKLLEACGCKLIKYTKGYFYVTAFFKRGDQLWYLSTGDVRNGLGTILVRTAKDIDDYTGGRNNFIAVDGTEIEQLQRIIGE